MKTPKKTISKKKITRETLKDSNVVSGYVPIQVESSYRENDLGNTLYNLVMELKPKTIIEFGTLNGYSAIAMAMALRDLGEGHLISYDLWDYYKFKHGNQAVVQNTIDELGLTEWISLAQGDLKHWEGKADLVHVDISNDGETLQMLKNKNIGGTVIFEGGTPERDKVQWMTKYNKMPMLSSGVRYDVINPRFPGLSKLI